jgi:hypothetical protein
VSTLQSHWTRWPTRPRRRPPSNAGWLAPPARRRSEPAGLAAGRTWLRSGMPQVLLQGLTASATRLARAANGLRLAAIAGLADEGLSHRQIGRYLAVSRQRVSSLLAGRNR